MKKIVSVMLVCLFLFTGVLASAFTVSADENVDFENADFEHFISVLVSSLQNVHVDENDKPVFDDDGVDITLRLKRTDRFTHYLDTIGKKDEEIDSLIFILFSGSDITDNMLNDLLDDEISKEQIRLVLEVLKSFPEEERAAAVFEFYNNQEKGAYYPFADPESDEYNPELVASYEGIYDHYINEEFRALVFADYGLQYIDFVPFMRVITNHVHFTKDSNGRLVPLSVTETFAENILANVTATSVNGVDIDKDDKYAKYIVLDVLLGKFSDATDEDNLDNFVGTFKGEDAYAMVGDFNADGRITSLDGTWMLRWLAEWDDVMEAIPEGSAKYDTGAQIKPDDNGLTTADVLKLLKYTSEWDGIILGRETNNYLGD